MKKLATELHYVIVSVDRALKEKFAARPAAHTLNALYEARVLLQRAQELLDDAE